MTTTANPAAANPDPANPAPAIPDPAIPVLRRATADDLPAIAVADGRAFGFHYSPTDVEDFRPLFDPERFLLARDQAAGGEGGDDQADDGAGGAIVGTTGSFPFDVTLPGGATLAAPGVTWVSVAVTHRRRGLLRALLAEQHRGFVSEGAAVSLLTASEGSIYGRFGYGVATVDRAVSIDRRAARFRTGAPDPGGVRLVDADTAREHAPGVLRRWCAQTPGALSRSTRWWDGELRDREGRRRGGTALFFLAHPDGYASYRIAGSECRVIDLFAATDDAHAALWRVLLALDLVETVTVRAFPLDDALPHLLVDARVVTTTGVQDGMWARVLDVPTALAARRYATEVDLVLDVTDPFLDRGGRFRLRGGPDGATCETAATGSAPDVALGVAELGSLLFGSYRAAALARAGLVTAADPAALHRCDTAFVTEREPRHGTSF